MRGSVARERYRATLRRCGARPAQGARAEGRHDGLDGKRARRPALHWLLSAWFPPVRVAAPANSLVHQPDATETLHEVLRVEEDRVPGDKVRILPTRKLFYIGILVILRVPTILLTLGPSSGEPVLVDLTTGLFSVAQGI